MNVYMCAPMAAFLFESRCERVHVRPHVCARLHSSADAATAGSARQCPRTCRYLSYGA